MKNTLTGALLFNTPKLVSADPEIYAIMHAEERRQRESVVLIASENYASAAVMEAAGSVLSNKYAEGYPERRYYGGCEWVDQAESLAIDRAKKLFGASHANVQPHSGAQANMAAFFTLLQPGDRVMGMALDHGGHLTHGSPVNFSGKLYNSHSYGVNRDTEQLDYDDIERQVKEFQPKLLIAGASAYARRIDFTRFRQIADTVGAFFVADIAHIAGLVATGAHPSPFSSAHIVTTTTHKTLRGPRGAVAFAELSLAKKYDSAVFPRMQGGPMMHTIAAKAVAFKEAASSEFGDYIRQVLMNTATMAKVIKDAGIRIVSGGTDNHMFLADVGSIGLTGAQAESTLAQAGIIVNRNMIPFDPNPPRVTAGIRIGTPAITSRGMKEQQAQHLAQLMVTALNAGDNATVLQGVHDDVLNLTRHKDFVPPGIPLPSA